jgi:hypothetical protein
MGRKSLEATKLLWSFMVRAAVDFFRGAWPFLADDFFWPVEVDEELFFLPADELLLFGFASVDVLLWADNPLLCSISSAARRLAVNRLR